jgi:hypothetical protein
LCLNTKPEIASVLVKHPINIDKVIQGEGKKNDEIDQKELQKKLLQRPVRSGQQQYDHAHQRNYPIHFLLLILSVFSHSIGRFFIIAFHLQ